MSVAASGNCDPKKSEVGADGLCYDFCPSGWSSVDNGPKCAKNCPLGFGASGTTQDSNLACIRPAFIRETKPPINCPTGSDRQYDKCLLDCPLGTSKKFNLCVPSCPTNFVETADGLSCQAEFVKRIATVREACYANETRIGGRICLGPCEAGTMALKENSEMCYATVPPALRTLFWNGGSDFNADIGPLISKIIFSRTQTSSTCPNNFESLNGQCFANCPFGSTAVGPHCMADCASDFKSTSNQSACIRPIRNRAVVTGVIGSIEALFSKFFLFIVSILGVAFLISLVNK